jgi:hypothetical protein
MSSALEKVVRTGAEALCALTQLKLASVAGAEPTDTGWHLQVELVEKESIPRGMDIIGLYDVWTDPQGQLLRFERRSTRRRTDTTGQGE